jgi:hypothetical protein
MVLHRLVSCNVSLKQSGVSSSAADNSLPQTVAQWQALSKQQLKADAEWRSKEYSESKLAWGIQFSADEELGLIFSDDAHFSSAAASGRAEESGGEEDGSHWSSAQPITKRTRTDEGGNPLNISAPPSYDFQAWGLQKPVPMAPPPNRLPRPIGFGRILPPPSHTAVQEAMPSVGHKVEEDVVEEEEEDEDVPSFARDLMGRDEDDRW